MEFEFDENKNEINMQKHGIPLMRAIWAFDDPDKIDFVDDRKDYGEERRICIGYFDGSAISVCYTIRGNNIRLISVRRASKKERELYYDNN